MWSQNFTIANKEISEKSPVFIIAEAGVNHNGDIKLAKQLIEEAAKCGADAIKFQTFIAEEVATFNAKKADYQEVSTGTTESQLDMIKKLELPFAAFKELAKYAATKGLIFLSTPFDPPSVEFLAELNVPAFKIASGEIINIPMLRKIAQYKRPIILSTGMATLGEVETALKVIAEEGEMRVVVLHCTTNYPAKIETANLRVIKTYKKAFRTLVGYSDHTEGIIVPIVAVALGAKVIEKHFTLDKNLPGPDHKASLSPPELKAMVDAIRKTEIALGTGVKIPFADELDVAKVARRSIVASRDLKAGEVLTEASIKLKRPADGLAPHYLPLILGQKLRCSVKKDDFISLQMIQWA